MHLVLIFAVLNVLVGYALAAVLADPPLGGFAPWKDWPLKLSRILPGSPVDLPHDTESIDELPAAATNAPEVRAPELVTEPEPALPRVATVDELPLTWRDLLDADRLKPRWFADGVAQGLRLQLAAYRQQVLAAEARARLVLSQESSEGLEQLVADFRFLHHEWLGRLIEGADLLRMRRGRLGDAEETAGRLETLLYDHGARMEATDRRISEINFKADIVLGCRRLMAELLELTTGVHLLRDDLATALASILRQQQMLLDLPREERLDPLTGRLNRIGLEAAFGAPSGTGPRQRQGVLVALDRFRRVNERLGTRAGDRTLRAFSQFLVDLLQSARASAEIARLSGTRFLLLLDGISRDQATSLAEQMRQLLEGVTFDCQGTCFGLSARLGISTVEQGEPLESLLARLSAAVEAAEIAGCNRCAVADAIGTRVVSPQVVPVISRRVTIGDPGELAGQGAAGGALRDSHPLPLQPETAAPAELSTSS